MGFTTWIDGRRTYGIAAASRVALVYLWANGEIGIAPAAAGFGLALGGTTLRAGLKGDLARLAKAFGKVAPLLLIVGVLVAAGCATLGGGTAEAKAAEKAAVLGAAVLIAPPFNLLVPGIWAIIEAVGVILAKPVPAALA